MDMIHFLNDRARMEGIDNLVSILASPEDPHLPQPVDLVFICPYCNGAKIRADYEADGAREMPN